MKIAAKMKEVGKKPALEFLVYSLVALGCLCAGIFIFLQKGASYLLIFPLVGLVVFTFFFFGRYGSKKSKMMASLSDEFVRLFTFFGIYINDDFNVYNALEEIRQYASPRFDAKLERLLLDIEEDKSVTPFVNFALGFESLQIKEVMVSIYQMVDEGNGGPYINQFQHLFGALSEQRHRSTMEKKLGTLENLGVLPLIGSGIAIMVLTVSIIEIMGGITSVL